MVSVDILLVEWVRDLNTTFIAGVIMCITKSATYHFPVFCVTENIDFNIFFGFCVFGIFEQFDKIYEKYGKDWNVV